MNWPTKSFLTSVLLVLGPFTEVAFAIPPSFLMDLTLRPYWRREISAGPASHYSPVVDSYANADLRDGVTAARLERTIILHHGVSDSNTGFYIFTARLVSPNGFMNSSTNDVPGDEGHCYRAQSTAYANDYNLQQSHPALRDCMPVEPHSERPVHEENCPVLLDLDLDGFHLSGPDPAVSFDIDADGTPDQIAWTKAGDDDAFLCLDRNRNGVIDDGTELFGYATPLLSGRRARIGYDALAELDWPELGGNGDRKVDAGDAMFHSLCVWNDRNRDGVSQPGEIQPAAAAGVVSLDYAFRETEKHDSFGNLFRYVSRAEMRNRQGRVRPWFTYDVIFADAEP